MVDVQATVVNKSVDVQGASQLCGVDIVIYAECGVVGCNCTLTRDMANPQTFASGYECTELCLLCYTDFPSYVCLNYEIHSTGDTHTGVGDF